MIISRDDGRGGIVGGGREPGGEDDNGSGRVGGKVARMRKRVEGKTTFLPRRRRPEGAAGTKGRKVVEFPEVGKSRTQSGGVGRVEG